MRNSLPKLSPTPKFPVVDKALDSQPKLSTTPKNVVAVKARDSQPKLQLQNFLLMTKPLSANLGVENPPLNILEEKYIFSEN